jgi:hypothetical protein
LEGVGSLAVKAEGSAAKQGAGKRKAVVIDDSPEGEPPRTRNRSRRGEDEDSPESSKSGDMKKKLREFRTEVDGIAASIQASLSHYNTSLSRLSRRLDDYVQDAGGDDETPKPSSSESKGKGKGPKGKGKERA